MSGFEPETYSACAHKYDLTPTLDGRRFDATTRLPATSLREEACELKHDLQVEDRVLTEIGATPAEWRHEVVDGLEAYLNPRSDPGALPGRLRVTVLRGVGIYLPIDIATGGLGTFLPLPLVRENEVRLDLQVGADLYTATARGSAVSAQMLSQYEGWGAPVADAIANALQQIVADPDGARVRPGRSK